MTQPSASRSNAGTIVSAIGVASAIYASYVLTAQKTDADREYQARVELQKQVNANDRDIALLSYRVQSLEARR